MTDKPRMPMSSWLVIFLGAGIAALLILLLTAVLWKDIQMRRRLEPCLVSANFPT